MESQDEHIEHSKESKMTMALFLEYAVKYGAIGVMALWLYTLNVRVETVEQRLYDCMEKRATTAINVHENRHSKPSELIKQLNPMLGIRQEELVIKIL